MRFLKIFTLILSLLFISFTASAEVIQFPSCTYEGEVDNKNRADGNGKCEFNNIGNVSEMKNFFSNSNNINLQNIIFEGTFKKNELKKGKFTDANGNILYEGKIKRGGNFYVYLLNDKKVRLKTIVNLDTGFRPTIQMKMMTKWYEAEEFNGVYQLTKKGEMEFQQAQSGGGDGGDGGGGGGGGGCGG